MPPLKTILLSGRAIGLLTISTILEYAWSQEPVVAPEVGDPFPLAHCIIGETPFDDEGDNPILIDQGRELRFCCDDCVNKFSEESYFRVDEFDKLLVEEQRPFYPLEKCVVTGETLESGAIDHIFRNRLFRLSSDAIRFELEKDPAKYFAELDLAVIEKQKPGYPLKTCVVSGEPLGDGAIDHVVANQLARLAGFDQFGEFNSNPGKYLAKIRAAEKKRSKSQNLDRGQSLHRPWTVFL